jgi:hypothetical protein
LRASFQAEYGLRLLRGGRVEPERTLREVSDLVYHLPPSSALWRAAGGDGAWTAESFLLAEVEFAVRSLHWSQTEDAKQGRNRPQRILPPKPAHEREAVEAAARKKAEGWTRLQQVRGAG